MNERDMLIDRLADDLQPVRSVGPRLGRGTLLWLTLSAVYVAAMTALIGPLRPGAMEQLVTHPRFLAECLVGALAIAVLARVGFRSAIPGALSRRALAIAAGLTLLWLLNYVVGFVSPALEPSMLGKRPHCYLETLILGLPPALAAVYWQHKLFPLRPMLSAALIGLAAGFLPALYMQIACMYAPGHILMWHILPGMVVACLAPLALVPGLLRRG